MAGNDFDPRTFFALHDIDGNGYWDQGEIEALFQLELDKMYNETNPNEDDPRERCVCFISTSISFIETIRMFQ
jgi:hypothetical protein